VRLRNESGTGIAYNRTNNGVAIVNYGMETTTWADMHACNLHDESIDDKVTFIMQRKSFKNMECPAARTLECVGEWWSILILRDAFHGLSRFDEFQSSLGIAPNILARRLKHLTQNDLLERRMYNPRPQRYEYVLTEKGRDFFPVLAAMLDWGNKHLAPEGVSVQLANRRSGDLVEPVLMDRHSLSPITAANVVLQPGPAASEGMRERAAQSKSRQEHAALIQDEN